MKQIKKGDIVGRKSYNNDVLFTVKDILEIDHKKIAILRGVIERVVVDSPLDDLQVIDKNTVKEKLKKFDEKIEERITAKKILLTELAYLLKINVLKKNF